MKLSVKIALAVVLLLALTTILVALVMYFQKHADLSKAKPDFVFTATALQKEFETDEKSASAKYTSKVLEVTGEIASISQSDSNNLNLSLKTGSDISSVICTFSHSKAPPHPGVGDEITIRGECSGFLMDVLLNNCAYVSK
jgi:hypothetical protein